MGKKLVKPFILFVLSLIGAATFFATPGLAATNVQVVDIYTPTSLVALQDTTVTAELTNSGDAGNFYLDLYIDGYWQGTW